MKRGVLLLAAWAAVPLAAQTRLLVTVIEQRSGKPVTGLTAAGFSVSDDKTPRAVREAAYVQGDIDVMLLVDTSLVGGMVQPVVFNLIDQLREKEQMALVSFADAADLVQDFTPTKDRLKRAISQVRYGNQPKLLDALYAAMNGGFESATFRRVVLLLTAGIEGYSRVSEREVIKLARRNGVSIYPVYMSGMERGMLESLARQTGGASFNLRDMGRDTKDPPGPRIFDVMRSHYLLTIGGNALPGEKLKVEAKGPQRLLISALPVE